MAVFESSRNYCRVHPVPALFGGPAQRGDEGSLVRDQKNWKPLEQKRILHNMPTPPRQELGIVAYGDPILVGTASLGCVIELLQTHELAVVTSRPSGKGTMTIRPINTHGEMPFLDQARKVGVADPATFRGFWNLGTPPI